MTATLDTQRVGAFAQQVGGMVVGGVTAAMIALGDKLGLYTAMSGSGGLTPEELAARTDTHERYVREWLAQQAAVGFVTYDPAAGTFALPDEHAAVLASEDSPASMIGAVPLVSGLHRRTDELAAAFRKGVGIPWSDQDPATLESTERFFRVAYRSSLVPDWIPALDGVQEKLRRGAQVADIGTGYGAPLLLLAGEFGRSRFVGYDVHPDSVAVATQRAAAAGLEERVHFEVNHCHGYPGEDLDLITFFDVFHDLGDPVGAAAHASSVLAEDGTVMLVEPLAADDLASTLATVPMAALSYAASTFLCTPNSLSQPVGLALGAQSGPARLTEVLHQGGFSRVRVAARTDFHMVIEARK